MHEERRARLLGLLARVAEELLQTIDPAKISAQIFDILKDELRLDIYFNYTPAGENVIRLESSFGLSDEQASAAAELSFGQAVCGCVAQRRTAMFETEIQNSSDPMLAFVKATGLDSYACTPLVVQGELLGTLGFGRRNPPPFDADELTFLRTACHYVALAKHRARKRIRELEEMRRQRDLLREREELRAKLAELNQLNGMSAVTATLAHELNQPLTAAGNYLSAALHLAEEGRAAPVEEIEAALDQVLRAGQIIGRVRGQIKGLHYRDRLSLQDLFADALATAQATGISAGVRTEARIDGEAGFVLGDRIQIQQVLANLIRNACEAMTDAEDPALSIIASPEEPDMVNIAVCDTGRGVDQERMTRLFDPVRVSSSGLGLGLVICRGIVEAHGGMICARARDPGMCIAFTLPRG